MGAARGVDEGLIGGAFKSKNFQDKIHYSKYNVTEQANIKANVSASKLLIVVLSLVQFVVMRTSIVRN